jgi:glyoxylase-like metal-dependent hydrolase (beta-lactamase superfamily II)
MKLYVFSSGILKSTKDKFALGAPAEAFDIPVPYYFVDISEMGVKALIDTGNSPGVIKDPKGTWGDIANVYYPVMTEEQKPVNALKEIGVKPEDINYIFITHLHLDHAGSIKYFPKAKVIVQLAELRYAYFPDPMMKGAYIEADIKDPSIKWEPIEGIRSFFGGRIFVFPTPGHTPGHQSILVRLKNNPVIITGDAVYLRENLEKDIPSGFAASFSEAAHSYQVIKHLAEDEKAKVWFGHDPDEWKKIKLAPSYYD